MKRPSLVISLIALALSVGWRVYRFYGVRDEAPSAQAAPGPKVYASSQGQIVTVFEDGGTTAQSPQDVIDDTEAFLQKYGQKK